MKTNYGKNVTRNYLALYLSVTQEWLQKIIGYSITWILEERLFKINTWSLDYLNTWRKITQIITQSLGYLDTCKIFTTKNYVEILFDYSQGIL